MAAPPVDNVRDGFIDPRERVRVPHAPLSWPGIALHPLVDGAEDRKPGAIPHLDPHPVAEAQERRHRLALDDRFNHAHLGNAGIADASLLDRPPRSAVLAAVRHGTRTHDCPSGEPARFGGLGEEGWEIA